MKRVVVIGAGAAGCMAAIFAAAAGAEVLLIERTRDGGRKILISGGGRCNVLPINLDETRFVTDSSPNLLRKMLRSWPLHEQVAFFETDLGIPLVNEPELGKRFPASHKARDVRDGLLSRARANGVSVLFDTTVADFAPDGAEWSIALGNGTPILADAVVVATGGLSVPNTGSDGTGLRVLEKLGYAMNPTYAALTPLTSNEAAFGALSGISFPLTLTARSGERNATASGGFLFTHHGYSGPSVLNVSHVAVRSRLDHAAPARVSVRWTALGDKEWEEAFKPKGPRTVMAALRSELPDRLVTVMLEKAGVSPARLLSELRRDERIKLIDMLVRGDLPWSGDEGYRKAEVTGGGVELSEVNPRTMESKRHPGLFICGEVLDAFGPIGGYNFAWAWATGRAAGIGSAITTS
ncbi:MAG: aminoacetone oxidase family FAD-binding enzyme [Gemmatimonadaceae bacterium]